MNELLVSKAQAEKVLREQSGDVVAALEAIISNWGAWRTWRTNRRLFLLCSVTLLYLYIYKL